MAKPQNLDKLVLSLMATVFAVTAWSLIMAGSFVPRWARPVNVSHNEANTSFSLWGREDCYGIICSTTYREEHSEEKRWWIENGEKKVVITEKVENVPIVTCVEANYCNTTWFSDVDFDQVPSLIFVARAFIIPSFIAGFLAIILYIIKIIMLVLRPTWRRLHIKAACLTFAAIAGVCAGIAVIIFCVMLEDEVYELLWAPALPGTGGILYLLIAIGGYLSWRNNSAEDDFDDRSDVSDRTSNIYEFSSSTKKKEGGGASRGAKAGYLRSVSNQSGKSDVL